MDFDLATVFVVGFRTLHSTNMQIKFNISIHTYVGVILDYESKSTGGLK